MCVYNNYNILTISDELYFVMHLVLLLRLKELNQLILETPRPTLWGLWEGGKPPQKTHRSTTNRSSRRPPSKLGRRGAAGPRVQGKVANTPYATQHKKKGKPNENRCICCGVSAAVCQ